MYLIPLNQARDIRAYTKTTKLYNERASNPGYIRSFTVTAVYRFTASPPTHTHDHNFAGALGPVANPVAHIKVFDINIANVSGGVVFSFSFWVCTCVCFFFIYQYSAEVVLRGLISKLDPWVSSMTSGCILIQGARMHVAEYGGHSVPYTVV